MLLSDYFWLFFLPTALMILNKTVLTVSSVGVVCCLLLIYGLWTVSGRAIRSINAADTVPTNATTTNQTKETEWKRPSTIRNRSSFP